MRPSGGFLLVVAIACGCGTRVATPLADKDDVSLQDLQGRWKLVSLEAEGKTAPTEDIEIMGYVLTIESEFFQMTLINGKTMEGGRLQLEPAARPVAIDQVIDEGSDKGTTEKGIIRIKDGRLQWSEAHPGHERPRDFSTPKGANATLAIFQRLPD